MHRHAVAMAVISSESRFAALEEITADEGIGLDSIAIMEFITLIEEHFSFKFDEEDLNGESFRNLRTLTHFIATKLETQQQTGGTRR